MSEQPEREAVQDEGPQPTKHSDAERVTSDQQSGSGENERGTSEDEKPRDVDGG